MASYRTYRNRMVGPTRTHCCADKITCQAVSDKADSVLSAAVLDSARISSSSTAVDQLRVSDCRAT